MVPGADRYRRRSQPEDRAISQELVFVASDEDAGERLDVVLARRAGCSRSAAARWVDEVDATVDGNRVKRSVTLAVGDRVVVPERPATERAPTPPVPPVRHRDEHLLVLAKPPGMVVHPGAGHHGDTLVDALRAADVPLAPGTGPDRPGIVHRLDRDTSGLLVVASTRAARDGLVDQLRARSVERRYLALVRGELPSTVGTVDAPIGRHPSDRQRFACVEGGRPARTHWEVLDVTDDRRVSLLACRLETGRTHQIRVHLQAVGHPVLGDDRYGDTLALAGELGVPRLALHAATLGFEHPVTGDALRLEEPLPADLATPAAALGLHVASP